MSTPHRPLRVSFARTGVSEVEQHAVTQELRDVAIGLGREAGYLGVIAGDE
jgi:hypothetical protein